MPHLYSVFLGREYIPRCFILVFWDWGIAASFGQVVKELVTLHRVTIMEQDHLMELCVTMVLKSCKGKNSGQRCWGERCPSFGSYLEATESSSHRVAYVYIEPQKQKNLGWLGHIERVLVPRCTGIVRSHYKDPQKLISILGCKTVLFQR